MCLYISVPVGFYEVVVFACPNIPKLLIDLSFIRTNGMQNIMDNWQEAVSNSAMQALATFSNKMLGHAGSLQGVFVIVSSCQVGHSIDYV